MNRLILFDIDNTLVTKPEGMRHSTHGVAFEHAFKRVFGVEANLDKINYHGMTDRGIMREILFAYDIPENEVEGRITDLLDALVDYYFENAGPGEVIELPGVKRLLDSLQERGAHLGLVTGNAEKIGRKKLSFVNLHTYFGPGGFGSDHHVRSELVTLAVKRTSDSTGIHFNGEVYVVGDTPRDVEAAKAGGAKSVAVATGIYSMEKLKAAEPDFLFEDFSDASLFLKAVGM